MTDIMTDAEVAEMLDCEVMTVQAKARDGVLPGIKIGRSWRFPKAALLQALNEMALRNKPASPAPAAAGRQEDPRPTCQLSAKPGSQVFTPQGRIPERHHRV